MVKQWSLDEVCDSHGYCDHIYLDECIEDLHPSQRCIIEWIADAYQGKNPTVLDVGCSTGRLSKFMPDNLQRYIGVDLNNKAICAGKEYFSDSSKVDLHVHDIEEDDILSIVGEGVDVVMFESSLTMLKDPLGCLKKLFSLNCFDVLCAARTPHNLPNTHMSLQAWEGMKSVSENWGFCKKDLEDVMPEGWSFTSLDSDSFVIERKADNND